MSSRANVLHFTGSRNSVPVDDLRKIVADLLTDAMPLDVGRLSPIIARLDAISPEAAEKILDMAPRELEAWIFGKQGRPPERYYEAAAVEFADRVREGERARAVRADIVDRLVAERPITRSYAIRRLKEVGDQLASKSAK